MLKLSDLFHATVVIVVAFVMGWSFLITIVVLTIWMIFKEIAKALVPEWFKALVIWDAP